MTKTEIKQNIHSLVDKVEDETVLEQIQEVVEYMATEGVITWHSLSEAERRSIEEGLEDIKQGRTIDYEDLKMKYPEWFGK
jgi:predicted transcriptional regulator